MKSTKIWLLPFIIVACGMPPKPRLERRTTSESDTTANSEPNQPATSAADADDELTTNDREAMEVLNQTMKERYRSARGVDLRGSREMLAPGLETATLRSFPALLDRLSQAFNRPVADIPLNDPSSFTISRNLQNDSPNYGVSGYRLFVNTVTTLCKGLVAASPATFALAPTADSARTQCQQWGERFWLRPMKDAELQICMNTAVEVTKSITNNPERWSQLCSVVAGAPQLLIVDAQQSASPSTGGTPAPSPAAPAIVGDANTGRQLFTASCMGCHGGNRAVRARTDAALQAAAANMNHIGREIYMVPPKVATAPTEYHHVLAFLKSLGT